MRSVFSRQAGAGREGVLLAAWAGLLAIVAAGELLPGSSATIVALTHSFISDIFLHVVAYAALGFVLALGVRFWVLITCLVISALVGVALEFLQSFVPGRNCDPYDAIANSIGLIAGTFGGFLIRNRLCLSVVRILSDVEKPW